jgi:predicted RNase H-like HicB family nuclease
MILYANKVVHATVDHVGGSADQALFYAKVWREGDWFVSQCLDVDVASQGETEKEALANLKEALELHFEPPLATHH